MNRQQTKELLPIIQAFAEGKTIQVKGPDNRWYDYDSKNCKLKFDSDLQKYRIKPKYRPFANKEECWNEMQKHQPFGWIKAISNKYHYSILEVVENGCIFVDGPKVSFYNLFKFDTFADGTPFGIEME